MSAPSSGVPPQEPAAMPARPPTSKAAVTSLVLGLLGMCTVGITGVIGLIVGVVAIVTVGRSRGRIGGVGYAIAGTVISAASLLFGCLTLGMMLPNLSQARVAAQQVKAQAQMREVAQAAIIYSHEFDGTLPVESWVEALLSQNYITEDVLVMPSASGEGRAFAANANLAGVPLLEVEEPQRTVLFFECAEGSPLSGGAELLPAQPRHHQGYLVVYVDGSVDIVSPARLGELRWEP